MATAVTDAAPAPSLARVLAYANDAIVHKFLERYEMSFEEARALFDETRKWLWLCSRAIERGAQLGVTAELFLLDEMWHTFILFTHDYNDFCHEYLGRFIHHIPTTQAAKDERAGELAARPDVVRAREQQRMREEFALIADELGADTLFKWFVDYPRRYGPEFVARVARTPSAALPAALTEQLERIAERYQAASSDVA